MGENGKVLNRRQPVRISQNIRQSFWQFCLLLLLAAPLQGTAQGIIFRNLSLDDAIALAKRERKNVFIDCYTDWCQPCKRMMVEVFSKQVVGRWFNNQFINIHLNMEKGSGLEAKSRYGIRFYPTFLFVNGDGEVVHRFAGYLDEKDFLFESEKSLLPGMGLRDLRAEFHNGNREPEFLQKYFDACALAHDLEFEELKAYLEGLTPEQRNLRGNLQLVFDYAVYKSDQFLDFDSKAYRHLLENEARYKRYFDEEKVEYRIVYIALKYCGTAIRAQNRTDFERAIGILEKWEHKPTLRNTDENGNLAGTLQTWQMTGPLRMTFYFQTGDERAFEEAELAYVGKIRHNAPQLDQLARLYYDWFSDPLRLTKAELWARTAIELDGSRPDFIATLGFIQFKRGEVENAKESARNSIALAKRIGADTDPGEKLLFEIETQTGTGGSR